MSNKKGQGGMTLMNGIVIAVITVMVVLFVGFKISDVFITVERADALASEDGVGNLGCNATATDNCGSSFAHNATVDLSGSSGMGLVKDLIPVMIIAVLGFGILAFFTLRDGRP